MFGGSLGSLSSIGNSTLADRTAQGSLGDTRLDLCRTTTPSPMVPISAFFRNSPPPLATTLSRSDSSQNSQERVGGPIISDPTGKCSGSPGGEYSDPPCLLRRWCKGIMLATWPRKSEELAPVIDTDDHSVERSSHGRNGSRTLSEPKDKKDLQEYGLPSFIQLRQTKKDLH